jgi:hypothetical protein
MRRFLRSGLGLVLAFALGVVLATAGTATAARLITGKEIKNGTIPGKDLSRKVRAKLATVTAAGVPGPQGPKGDAGAAGADGADGAPGTNGVSGYEMVSQDTVFPAGTTFTFQGASVTCPAGKVPLGGGVEFRSPTTTITSSTSLIHASAPTPNGKGWLVSFQTNVGGLTGIDRVRVYVSCMSAP